MKEGRLFCFVVMKSIKPGCFKSYVLGVVGKVLMRGVHGLGSMTFGLVVQKFLHIE